MGRFSGLGRRLRAGANALLQKGKRGGQFYMSAAGHKIYGRPTPGAINTAPVAGHAKPGPGGLKALAKGAKGVLQHGASLANAATKAAGLPSPGKMALGARLSGAALKHGAAKLAHKGFNALKSTVQNWRAQRAEKKADPLGVQARGFQASAEKALRSGDTKTAMQHMMSAHHAERMAHVQKLIKGGDTEGAMKAMLRAQRRGASYAAAFEGKRPPKKPPAKKAPGKKSEGEQPTEKKPRTKKPTPAENNAPN